MDSGTVREGSGLDGGNAVAEALGRLCDIAALRQPDDPLLVRFLPLYYSELPADDVDDRKLDDVYAVACAHLALGRTREPGEPVARVLSPDRERDGWHSQHSVVLVVTDDMPFLVDTMRMVLERRGLGVHLLVHPMLRAVRDEADRLVDVAPDSVDDVGTLEAWTQIEIDRTDRATAADVEAEILRAVADVQVVVDDFPAMRGRMDSLAGVAPILPWLAAGQFVFLGAADYDVAPDGGLTLREGSELGLARGDDRARAPRPMPAGRPVTIARTDDVSSVFRDERQTVVAVDTAGATVQTRFVGLLATNAYRVSVLDIPGVGDAVADALDLSPARMHAHTGRATRTVLENLPRDLVLGARADRPGAAGGVDRGAPGAPARARVRGPRARRALGDRARLPAPRPVHGRAPRPRRRRRRPRLRGRPADVRDGCRRQLAGPDRGERAARRGRPPGRPRRPGASRRRAVDGVVGRAAGGPRRRRRGGARPHAVRRRRRPRAGRLRRGREPRPRDQRRAPHRRPPRVRRRADHLPRPRRRRAAGGVALPRLPARRPGRPVRAAAAARPPRVAGPRRTAVHVPPRRRPGLRLRHRGPGRHRRRPRRAAPGRPAGCVHGPPGWFRRERRLQPAGPARRAERARSLARAGVRQVPAPDRVRVQPGVRGSGPRRPPAPRRRPRRPVPHPLRPHPLRRHAQPRARRRGRGARRDDHGRARRHPEPRRRPHLPGLPHPRQRHGAHELLPGPQGDRPQARSRGDPRAPAAEAEARDLGLRAPRRGGAPARRRHRPRRAALERPPGGLPHRGPRPDEGTDGQERGDRAERREGRLRRQAPAR